MKNWDKILADFARKCKGGAPDMTNSTHLALLRESLIKFGWKENATNEFIGNLREGKEIITEDEPGVFMGYTNKNKKRYFPNADKLKAAIDRKSVTAAPNSGGGAAAGVKPKKKKKKVAKHTASKGGGSGKDKKNKIEVELDINAEREKLGELDKNQQSISDGLSNGNLDKAKNSQVIQEGKRDKGTAGAGGGSASQGESRFVSATNTMPEYDDLYPDKNGKPNPLVEKKKSEIEKRETAKKNKYPNKEEKEVLKTFGWDSDDKKARTYFAKRELWAEEELARIKKDRDSVFYTKGRMGFNGNDEAYLSWMRAAFDGAQATRDDIEHNSNIDSSKDYTVMQSDNTEEGHDKAIKNHLLDEYEKAKKSGDTEAMAHYKKQYELMSKLEFHDTFALGQDENGRTTIYHISNKKGSDISEAQNNTTPAKRIKVIIATGLGKTVAKRVGQALEDGLKKVETVKQTTVTASQNVKVDSEVGKICETPEMKSTMDALDNHEKFREWVKTNGKKYVTGQEKAQAAQDYIKYLKSKKNRVSYAFGKLFAKIGENARLKKFKNDYPKIKVNSPGVVDCIGIKEEEKTAVEETYQDVIDNITKADNAASFPDKDGNNGPHTQGYLSTVFHAMHADMYIDNYDGDTGIVSGVRSAQPSDIRECLAEKTGYDKPEPPKEEKEARKKWRDGLKDHLRKKCDIDATTGGIIVEGPDPPGGHVKLFKDEWRSGGTSTQKVASYYEDDMKDCMKKKIDKRRQSQSGIA